MTNMRIEINLPKEIAEKIKEKAVSLNHSRKSYIEYLCLRDVMDSHYFEKIPHLSDITKDIPPKTKTP